MLGPSDQADFTSFRRGFLLLGSFWSLWAEGLYTYPLSNALETKLKMKLIHLVGKVGAGKSHFARKYFSQDPVFDIKDVYEKYGVSPAELRDPNVYRQFASAVAATLDNFCRQYHDEPIAFIESSGINQAINQALRTHPHKVLLIQSKFSESIASERPYAPALNLQIKRAIDSKKMRWDYRFDGNKASFYLAGDDQNGLGDQNAKKWKEKILQEK
ncbi:MAG: hypothetical protein ACTSYI_11020 [Promethearchaeota archaeon]